MVQNEKSGKHTSHYYIVDASYLQQADGLNNDIQTVQKLQLSGSF